MRICSFFSSGTELLGALGLTRSIVGRSETCDFPPAMRRVPVVVRSRVRSSALSSRGIHEAVDDLRRRGEPHYTIDLARLARLRPDVVVTQTLCNVCAASHPEVFEAVAGLPSKPRIVTVDARRLDELLQSIQRMGDATQRRTQAAALIARMRRRVDAIQRTLRGIRHRPGVWCAEWLDPLMAGGHWVPEIVELAGGCDLFGHPGRDSECFTWDDIRQRDPEVIAIMPCSFSLVRTVKESPRLTRLRGWSHVRAVQAGRVFAVNASLFHRPGPRLLDGLQLMASLCHPDRFPKPSAAYARRIA